MQNDEHWARRLGGNWLRPDAGICKGNVFDRPVKDSQVVDLAVGNAARAEVPRLP
jgi:hypothetical protein